MKIAVIGAGIIGVTTAWELARDGHNVTVLERRGAVAEEASFANAGIMAPGMPIKTNTHLFNRFASVKVGLPLTRGELAWMWRCYRSSKLDASQTHLTHLQRLASFSRERLHHITAELKLEYERSDGYTVLLRTENDSQLMQPGLQMLRDAGIAFKEIDPIETRKIETALNPDTDFFGAIHLPDAEVGNSRQFALLLKNEAQQLGVKFEFNTNVTQIQTAKGVTIQVAGDSTSRSYDAAVMCSGLDSHKLLSPLGLKIPLTAVYGYSVSATIREPLNGPRSAVMDERYGVAISRLGNRVRVAGSTELGGSPDKKCAHSLQTLYKVLHDWFPGAANLSSGVQEWKGARPMLPDGLPILGASGLTGLWLNLGHGANGWGLGCGSARVLADQMGGRTPELDLTGLGIERLRI